jgi:hypothetical protein
MLISTGVVFVGNCIQGSPYQTTIIWCGAGLLGGLAYAGLLVLAKQLLWNFRTLPFKRLVSKYYKGKFYIVSFSEDSVIYKGGKFTHLVEFYTPGSLRVLCVNSDTGTARFRDENVKSV